MFLLHVFCSALILTDCGVLFTNQKVDKSASCCTTNCSFGQYLPDSPWKVSWGNISKNIYRNLLIVLGAYQPPCLGVSVQVIRPYVELLGIVLVRKPYLLGFERSAQFMWRAFCLLSTVIFAMQNQYTKDTDKHCFQSVYLLVVSIVFERVFLTVFVQMWFKGCKDNISSSCLFIH